MLSYRKTTRGEDETWELHCNVLKPNQMLCDRRVTRFCNGEYLCEGHFQVKKQISERDGEVVVDMDQQAEERSGKSEPMEK